MKFPKKKWTKNRQGKNLVSTLDRWFSLFIRLRDADSNGICRCITCGTLHPWNAGDAGHFISRDHKATRYDPRNSNFQCAYCNRFQSGRQYEHGMAIDKKWGAGTAEQIKNLSQVPYCKLDDFYLETKIAEYKKKAKELKLKLSIK